MTGGGADGCDDDNDNDDDKDDDDNGNKVPDCLQVVSSILSDLDTDIHRSRVPTCQVIQTETTTIDIVG